MDLCEDQAHHKWSYTSYSSQSLERRLTAPKRAARQDELLWRTISISLRDFEWLSTVADIEKCSFETFIYAETISLISTCSEYC